MPRALEAKRTPSLPPPPLVIAVYHESDLIRDEREDVDMGKSSSAGENGGGKLKRKATVAVEVLPGGGGMQEGPFVCANPAVAGGLPPAGTEFRAFRKNKAYRGHHLVLRGRADGVDYVGSNHAGDTAGPTDACKYLVARLCPVKSKNGGGGGGGGGDGGGGDGGGEVEYTLQVMPMGGGRVFNLETRCHALSYAAPQWDGAEDLTDYAVRAAHNDKLLKAFSSAKRQRKVAKIQAERRIDSSTLAAPDAMAETLKAATAGEMDAKQLAALAGTRRNIPSHNPEATNPFDAFPFAMFPMHALLDRTKWKEFVKASKKPAAFKELEASGDVDPFTLSLVSKLAEPSGGGTGAEEAVRQKDRAKALGALDFLLLFHGHRGVVTEDNGRSRGAGRESKNKEEEDNREQEDDEKNKPRTLSWAHESKVDPVIQRAVIDEFMEEQFPEVGKGTKDDPKRYARPKAMKDLVTLHLILMALRVCGWSVDVTALAKRLKVSVTDLTPHCKELGCKVTKTTGKKSEGGGITKASLPLDGTKKLGDLLPEIRRRLQAKKG